MQSNSSNGRKRKTWLWLLLAVTVCGYYYFTRHHAVKALGTEFVVRKGPLDINVAEGGSVEALESQDVKSEVRGYQGTKILKIIEEGYLVTDEDVRTNKVLVELDSSEIKKQITQQEIQFQSTLAALTEAQQAYDIQLNQNLSDLKAAEQKAKFARMDLEKFLGDKVAEGIINQMPPPPNWPSTSTNLSELDKFEKTKPIASNDPVVSSHADHGPNIAADVHLPKVAAEANFSEKGDSNAVPTDAPKEPTVNFANYANVDLLGDGEAKQKIRKAEDDLQVAQKEFNQNKNKLDGTKRLFDKGFATKTELEADEIILENSRLKVQTAETARSLFLKYEFVKTGEETLSKYLEAARELERARKSAVSKLAQADAKLKASQGRYQVDLRQNSDLNDQLGKCTIIAKRTGLVVYGGNNQFYYYNQEPIREGALVREQQPIITIPDMTRMSLNVRIHESYIKKIKKGQKVKITVDAFPDKNLEGEVTKVGVLPDSQNRWMNPELKVYLTTITISGVHDWLKPGMSAKAEIKVKKLNDVVYVPIQAILPEDGKQFVYMAKTGDRKQVKTGEFNDEFIEVTSGLNAGDVVLLQTPESTSKGSLESKESEEKKETPPTAAAAAKKAV